MLAAACACAVFAQAAAALPQASRINCGSVGLDAAAAKKAYGANASVVPNLPNACNVVLAVKHGKKLVTSVAAIVSFYSKSEWPSLTLQARKNSARVVYLKGLGKAAVLFDLAKAPFFYQENVDLIARSFAVVIAPSANVSATTPPQVPAAALTALAAAVHAKLG